MARRPLWQVACWARDSHLKLCHDTPMFFVLWTGFKSELPIDHYFLNKCASIVQYSEVIMFSKVKPSQSPSSQHQFGIQDIPIFLNTNQYEVPHQSWSPRHSVVLMITTCSEVKQSLNLTIRTTKMVGKWALALWGAAKGRGLVQPKEKMVSGGSHSTPLVPNVLTGTNFLRRCMMTEWQQWS